MAEPKKILIVEDDQFTRELYEEVLKNAGFTVDTAVDGAEGLKKIRLGGHDMILLDIMLPILDGLGILTELQKSPPAAPVGTIVMLTNISHDPILQQAKALGARDYLLKANFNPDQLVAQIRTLLENVPPV